MDGARPCRQVGHPPWNRTGYSFVLARVTGNFSPGVRRSALNRVRTALASLHGQTMALSTCITYTTQVGCLPVLR